MNFLSGSSSASTTSSGAKAVMWAFGAGLSTDWWWMLLTLTTVEPRDLDHRRTEDFRQAAFRVDADFVHEGIARGAIWNGVDHTGADFRRNVPTSDGISCTSVPP